MPSRTSRFVRRNCGGIFDYDTKKARLVEVAKALEDPGVWNDAKRAQDLGKERSALDATVGNLEKIAGGLADSRELEKLGRVLEARIDLLDRAQRLFEGAALLAEVLRAFRVRPHARIFQRARDFYEPRLLGVVVKDTSGARPSGRRGRGGNCR